VAKIQAMQDRDGQILAEKCLTERMTNTVNQRAAKPLKALAQPPSSNSTSLGRDSIGWPKHHVILDVTAAAVTSTAATTIVAAAATGTDGTAAAVVSAATTATRLGAADVVTSTSTATAINYATRRSKAPGMVASTSSEL
jgi:hypothetical protein